MHCRLDDSLKCKRTEAIPGLSFVLPEVCQRVCKDSLTPSWTDECEQAFNLLKHHLISVPILRLPNFSQDFILDVHASENSLGAVLSQADGHEQVVAYASRTLTKAERNYCAIGKELLALVWGVRHFRPYLFGRTFIARTDHNSLKWLRNLRGPRRTSCPLAGNPI